MRKRYTVEERERLVTEVRSTGETVRVVAARLGICVSTAYLWMRGVAPAPGAPVFARVMPAPSAQPPSVVVEVGRARLRVEVGFDPVTQHPSRTHQDGLRAAVTLQAPHRTWRLALPSPLRGPRKRPPARPSDSREIGKCLQRAHITCLLHETVSGS